MAPQIRRRSCEKKATAVGGAIRLPETESAPTSIVLVSCHQRGGYTSVSPGCSVTCQA